jgi:hypothetical protein
MLPWEAKGKCGRRGPTGKHEADEGREKGTTKWGKPNGILGERTELILRKPFDFASLSFDSAPHSQDDGGEGRQN